MKWFLILWAGPIGFLGLWYGLSYYDLNFGMFFFSRQMHDLVFRIYGNILGIPPESIPPLVLKALALDTTVLMALVVLRRRKRVFAWWNARRIVAAQPAEPAESAESLSSAP
ncbi:DUF6105 family protein [Pararhizobium mangrovi]|uniref:Transmembrane protein n=1 Tax=Pararhizobium mangrovi TaxID=2590452 RepID=A0A506U080_9HYPH|nr:DUF6105 family protein [Pararhizobium mangrovi]TPW27180.1 hypothetical protein FJU11_12335 [Pararhizobium mangrovi]